MRKARYTILIVSFLIGGSLYGVHSYNLEIVEQFVQEAKDKRTLLEGSRTVWGLWREGSASLYYEKKKINCHKNLKGNGSCNQSFLECSLKSIPIKVMKKGSSRINFIELSNITRSADGSNYPLEGTEVILSYKKQNLSILLENSCSKLFLPKRIYGFGVETNPEASHRFDNFQQDLFIDKKMTPSKGMTLMEMKNSCASRGMQLLEGHLLDAASFHPVDLKNNRPKYFIRPRLPWTRKYKTEFVAQAKNNKNFKFELKFCDFLYSKECRGLENKSFPSWMGLKNPLGGLVEIVRNVEFPSKNLVPSSKYFRVQSKWHSLGLRSLWRGGGFGERDFEIRPEGIEDFKSLETGFRCMQEVWNK